MNEKTQDIESLRKDRYDWFKLISRHYWDYMWMCQESWEDFSEEIAGFLRNNDSVYFAPITFWVDLLEYCKIEIDDDNPFHVEETLDSVRIVHYEAVIHSLRVLLDRCAQLINIKFPEVDPAVGFGYYEEGGGNKNKGLIKYAYEHKDDDEMFKWITWEYEEWILNINKFDNGIKHNYSSESRIPCRF